MKMFVTAVITSTLALSALANPLTPKSQRQNVQYAGEDAVRLADVPIVRSSKGCIAYLKEDKRGLVKVVYPKDKSGKRVCHPKFSYDAPESAEKSSAPY
jgi:hypothetical protein